MKTQTLPVNSIRLCLDHCDGSLLDGTIIGVALKEPMTFKGLRAFVAQVDAAFDQIGRPQPHQITRSFRNEEAKPSSYMANPEQYHEAGEIQAWLGMAKTLDLIMLTRHYTEWQGILKNADGTTAGHFNSVLECIRLITQGDHSLD
ncbi:hypothetical protein [Eubacterium sp. 1001713B170207_170306_E7]|uniref:hypothetical protein n=1 Tax=Eubacterium sp. 1001713B170207_170306_E7 TaxID=2787097 RepID=UPI001898A243|nr:hypothetical protein [Eubacterium sp. 1001713B170207_170306_E7]